MVAHKCIQETPIALLSKSTTDMADKINKIENSVETIRIDLQKVKDFMGTMEIASERNNADIKQLIQSEFNSLKIKFKDEKEESIKELKVRTKENYANKGVEKFLIWMGGIIGATFITALTLAVMKLVGKI